MYTFSTQQSSYVILVISVCVLCNGFSLNVTQAVSELTATATATIVAKGVAEDILCFNAWWHGDPAVAAATVTHSANITKPAYSSLHLEPQDFAKYA